MDGLTLAVEVAERIGAADGRTLVVGVDRRMRPACGAADGLTFGVRVEERLGPAHAVARDWLEV